MRKSVAYTEIENADKSDIGKTCLMAVSGHALAIEETLEECIAAAKRCWIEFDESEIDDGTDFQYLKMDDLVVVNVVYVEAQPTPHAPDDHGADKTRRITA